MTLIDIRPGEMVTINGITGKVVGLNGVPDKVAFIDIEQLSQSEEVFKPAFPKATWRHL